MRDCFYDSWQKNWLETQLRRLNFPFFLFVFVALKQTQNKRNANEFERDNDSVPNIPNTLQHLKRSNVIFLLGTTLNSFYQRYQHESFFFSFLNSAEHSSQLITSNRIRKCAAEIFSRSLTWWLQTQDVETWSEWSAN